MQHLARETLMAVRIVLHWYMLEGFLISFECVVKASNLMTSIVAFEVVGKFVAISCDRLNVEIFKKSVFRRSKMPLLQQTFAD